MSETLKTLTFLVVAAAVVLAAVLTRPSLKAVAPEDFRNKPLYPDFNDPLAVTDLEIVEFDEETSTMRPFQVAQIKVGGKARWAIPSHENYPADAKDQVASAAAGLMGLKKIELASDNQGDQKEYGVIDPDPKSVKFGDTGVGERVVMKDKNGKELLALIIGKEVPDRTGLRYVRKVGEDAIYVVEAKTDKLFTKFENWIERNLLQINTLDMSRIWISDYSVDVVNEAIDQRGETILEYNDAGEPKWKLVEDRKFNGKEWTPIKLPENEELNTAKLDELKTALDDLKIVDVSRKPAGLSTNLKAAANFASQGEAVVSLAKKGFYAAKLPGSDQVELFSNEGEFRVGMKDGVEYVLRFGNVTGKGAEKKDDKKKGDGKDAGKDAEKKNGSPGMNRYLFVMAEFNPNLIPKPQPLKYPEAKQEARKPADEKKSSEVKIADEKKPDEKKPDAAKPEEKKPDDKAAVEKKPENKPEEKAAAEKKPETKPEEKAPEKTEAEKKAEAALRERIDKENKRLQEEYDQKIADGKKHVGELNARFADWYYVISDEVFQKIHLGRDSIFKKKEIKKDKGPGKGPEAEPEPAKHEHEDAATPPAAPEATPSPPATPNAELEKLKNEGPDGK